MAQMRHDRLMPLYFYFKWDPILLVTKTPTIMQLDNTYCYL